MQLVGDRRGGRSLGESRLLGRRPGGWLGLSRTVEEGRGVLMLFDVETLDCEREQYEDLSLETLSL